MNPFDMLMITIMAYGLIRGVFRGLVREIASIVGVLGGFYAAYSFYPLAGRLMAPWITNAAYLNIISYMAIFAAVVIAVGVLAVVIKYLLNIAYLGWVDRIGGALFGMVKGLLVVAVLFIVLTAFLPKGTPFIQNAALAPPAAAVSEIMATVLSKDMKEKFSVKLQALRQSWQSR